MYRGQTLALLNLEDGIAELRFDAADGPVNKLSRVTIEELSAALDVLEAANDVTGLLISSGKDSFIVGADITEFGPVFSLPRDQVRDFLMLNNQNFNRIEDLPFPTLVAIDGFALGGGLELSVASDFRVATTRAVVGFPETQLGIIPGWGGTVRAPRLIGFDNAVEWIATGAQQKAERAFRDGMVDAIVEPDKLREQALLLLNECISGAMDYLDRRQRKQAPLKLNAIELEMAVQTGKAIVLQKAGRNYPAPVAAVEVMGKAAAMHRNEALEVEFEAFYQMIRTPQCRALVGLFLNDQHLGRVAKKLATDAPAPVQRCGVLGAGVMGGGIAYQNALKGIAVQMKDIRQDSLDLGMKEANKLLAGRVDKGRMSALEAGSILSAITPSLNYSGMESCQTIIEAVVEQPKVKQQVLAEVEQLVPPDTVLVSNTSTISIDLLASSLQRPENFCGMHFFNPVHRMPLVEVIRGSGTAHSTVATVVSHALALGKKPVVVNDCPGFLVNRVLFPYFAGFNLLLRDGADFTAVDKVMEGWGWPMGPAYLLDVVGLDVAVHAGAVMAEGFPDRMADTFRTASRILYENQRLGQKNGRGFYRYTTDKRGKPAKVADPDVPGLLADAVQPAREVPREEIVARMMIPMAVELARCLEEGIVNSPAEADMALVYGLGFPPFRGGVFRWLTELGVAEFCQMATAYAGMGKLYQPTETMLTMAEQGRGYY